jgi:hypothetical protein
VRQGSLAEGPDPSPTLGAVSRVNRSIAATIAAASSGEAVGGVGGVGGVNCRCGRARIIETL